MGAGPRGPLCATEDKRIVSGAAVVMPGLRGLGTHLGAVDIDSYSSLVAWFASPDRCIKGEVPRLDSLSDDNTQHSESKVGLARRRQAGRGRIGECGEGRVESSRTPELPVAGGLKLFQNAASCFGSAL